MHESKVHMFPLKEAHNKNTEKILKKTISLWLTQVAFNSKFNSKSFLLVLGSFIKSVIIKTGRAHPDLFILGMDTCVNWKHFLCHSSVATLVQFKGGARAEQIK